MALMLGADVAFSTGVGSFTDPESMTWHSLFWAEGTDFAAQGYSDTDPVSTWPNETGESDLTQTGADRGTYTAAIADLNNQPGVVFSTSQDMSTAAFTTAPDYTSGVSIVAVFTGLSGGLQTYPVFDGLTSVTRQFLAASGSLWALTSGSVITGGTPDANAHFARCFFSGSGGGNESIHIDETLIVSGDGGNQEMTGLRLNQNHSGSNNGGADFALLGIYEGDITADPMWSDFTAWISSHYGISL